MRNSTCGLQLHPPSPLAQDFQPALPDDLPYRFHTCLASLHKHKRQFPAINFIAPMYLLLFLWLNPKWYSYFPNLQYVLQKLSLTHCGMNQSMYNRYMFLIYFISLLKGQVQLLCIPLISLLNSNVFILPLSSLVPSPQASRTSLLHYHLSPNILLDYKKLI